MIVSTRKWITCCSLCLAPLASAGLDGYGLAVVSLGEVTRAESTLDDLVPFGDEATYRERISPQVDSMRDRWKRVGDSLDHQAYAACARTLDRFQVYASASLHAKQLLPNSPEGRAYTRSRVQCEKLLTS
ncbi:hypothetical protein [Chitinolyticbacter meiyuanensis]|uniref:hypothetical protein n=1 Tax=Chitinolyticbacter meiyuanensis TaxID=682798 RepID=UPI0011E5B7F4|nr:hypothetical protein [Chitinolyticbacter meiyuanensis]